MWREGYGWSRSRFICVGWLELSCIVFFGIYMKIFIYMGVGDIGGCIYGGEE